MCTVSSKKGKLYDLTLPVLYLAQIKIIWFNVTHTGVGLCGRPVLVTSSMKVCLFLTEPGERRWR